MNDKFLRIPFKHRLRKLSSTDQKLENYFTNGRIAHFVDGDCYVDAGLKSLVKLSKQFLNDRKIIPHIGLKVPIYVSRYCDHDGRTRIDQNKLTYALMCMKLHELSKNGKHIYGQIMRIKGSGYIVSILPHLINGDKKTFLGFMPNVFSGITNYQRKLKVGQQLKVSIKSLDMAKQSMILHSEENGEDEKSFKTLMVGDRVSGKVMSFRTYGIIMDVDDNNYFLSYRDLSFSPKVDNRHLLNVGQIIHDLIVYKKDEINKKVYLTAKHIYDSLYNYFEIGERVQCQVINVQSFGYFVTILKYSNVPFKAYLNFRDSS